MSHEATHAAESHDDHAHDSGGGLSVYFLVFLVLLVLLAATYYAATINMSYFNVPVAYGIAVVKGVLILWFFMHLRQGTRLTQVFAFASFAWLALMLIMTLGDYFSRNILTKADAVTRIRKVDSYNVMSGVAHASLTSENEKKEEGKE